MGYIYKITNPEDGKVYIGQTVQNYKDRWSAHKRDRLKEPYNSWPLYRVLNKISPENAIWEVIEQVPNEELDVREKYWIKFYDSQNNGYNCTSGGSQGTKYNYEQILQYWLREGKRSIHQTASFFEADDRTISRAIQSLGYSSRTPKEVAIDNAEKRKKSVNQIDPKTGRVLKTFDSLIQAGQYMGNIEYTKTLCSVCSGKRPTYLGYCWQYAEDIGKPILLDKQRNNIFLPEQNLLFESINDTAKWFIEKGIPRSKNIKTISGSISYALHHSKEYFGIKLEQQQKVIISYYPEAGERE